MRFSSFLAIIVIVSTSSPFAYPNDRCNWSISNIDTLILKADRYFKQHLDEMELPEYVEAKNIEMQSHIDLKNLVETSISGFSIHPKIDPSEYKNLSFGLEQSTRLGKELRLYELMLANIESNHSGELVNHITLDRVNTGPLIGYKLAHFLNIQTFLTGIKASLIDPKIETVIQIRGSALNVDMIERNLIYLWNIKNQTRYEIPDRSATFEEHIRIVTSFFEAIQFESLDDVTKKKLIHEALTLNVPNYSVPTVRELGKMGISDLNLDDIEIVFLSFGDIRKLGNISWTQRGYLDYNYFNNP